MRICASRDSGHRPPATRQQRSGRHPSRMAAQTRSSSAGNRAVLPSRLSRRRCLGVNVGGGAALVRSPSPPRRSRSDRTTLGDSTISVLRHEYRGQHDQNDGQPVARPKSGNATARAIGPGRVRGHKAHNCREYTQSLEEPGTRTSRPATQHDEASGHAHPSGLTSSSFKTS